ncbi:hypothetical protein B0H10DRAFT_1951097 [Mycena sp. CBHHK59/15]|nr:hypothetical protein B0H10DRAFT_1951097 [Mycena sp. CBHHK59/15]
MSPADFYPVVKLHVPMEKAHSQISSNLQCANLFADYKHVSWPLTTTTVANSPRTIHLLPTRLQHPAVLNIQPNPPLWSPGYSVPVTTENGIDEECLTSSSTPSTRQHCDRADVDPSLRLPWAFNLSIDQLTFYSIFGLPTNHCVPHTHPAANSTGSPCARLVAASNILSGFLSLSGTPRFSCILMRQLWPKGPLMLLHRLGHLVTNSLTVAVAYSEPMVPAISESRF